MLYKLIGVIPRKNVVGGEMLVRHVWGTVLSLYVFVMCVNMSTYIVLPTHLVPS